MQRTNLNIAGVVESLAITDKAGEVICCHELNVLLEGIEHDRHGGFTRKADGRDTGIKRGTPVRNWRQWSAVSKEELEIIASKMGLQMLDSLLLSANVCFSGIADLTKLSPGTTIWFPGGAVLSVEGENAPCINPGKKIAQVHQGVKPHDFPKAAAGLRGLVGVVYKAGTIRVGDIATVKLPQ